MPLAAVWLLGLKPEGCPDVAGRGLQGGPLSLAWHGVARRRGAAQAHQNRQSGGVHGRHADGCRHWPAHRAAVALTAAGTGPPQLPQVYVAKRDGAKNIFKQYLDSQGGKPRVRLH